MQLQLRPYNKNIFPLGGVLVKSASVADWLQAVQQLQLSLAAVRIFPIPGNTPNSIWGCLIRTQSEPDRHLAGKNEFFQVVTNNFFIAEKAILHPAIAAGELVKLLSSKFHIFHPDFGMVELQEEFVPADAIERPVMRSYYVSKPVTPDFLPQRIKSFHIEPVSPEQALKDLEEKMFPVKEPLKHKPLSLIEKGKLLFYQAIFKQRDKTPGKGSGEPGNPKELGKLERWLVNMFGSKFGEGMMKDLEDLERRNQKEVDRLLTMLMSNPEEALKYALPLDDNGSSRGGEKSQLTLNKRWADLSWSGSAASRTGSGSVDLGDRYHDLRKQYLATAEQLVSRKKFHDAAFVYMKLLKDPASAAIVLENGRFYFDAATIYLKHTGNKPKAAECYEKGSMTMEAIEIYKELREDEKVGDLYSGISKKKEADVYYHKVADAYKGKDQFVKAALVYKGKIGSMQEAQAALMQGWEGNKDAVNCLTNYFSNISDTENLQKEIDSIYQTGTGTGNSERFLHVIKQVFDNRKELSDHVREIAYEIVAANITTKPMIVSELKSFNPGDKELPKDALRYKVKNKK